MEVAGARYEQTVCGLFVSQLEVAPAEHEPTCSGCREWLGLKNEPVEADTHTQDDSWGV